MSPGEPEYEVAEWRDDALILPLLERDRLWSAYAICDLEPPYRQNNTVLGASLRGVPSALLSLYALPGIVALLPYGEEAGLRAILSRAQDLPDTVFYIAEDRHLPALAETYELEPPERMSRMTVDPCNLVGATPPPLPLEPLTPADAEEIAALYRIWGPTFFDATMIQAGIYFGCRVEGRLVAIAGTHAMAPRRGVAAIGGVFTHPEFRGRGLATATTGAVARELVAHGAQLIVLNVRADNLPAVSAYSRLGFRHWLHFNEGQARRR